MDIHSINIDKVMEKLDGSKKLLDILFKGFLKKYSKVDEEISNLLNNGKYEDARRLTHNIKGLSGNLAAEGLNQEAIRLEEAIKDNNEDIEALLKSFSLELKNVVTEIKQLAEDNYGKRNCN